MGKSPARTREFAFLISGLMDCLFGGILLLSWLNIIPLDLTEFGLTRGWVGLIGAVMAVSGVVVVTYQLTKLKEPDQ